MERREEEEMEAFRKRIIEEERERLLRAHAPNLLGYLPKVRAIVFVLFNFRFAFMLGP